MLFPALVTILALILYCVTFFNVGQARAKYGVKAPATTGNEQFERYFRIQMNTLEQLVVFLPALWLAAMSSSGTTVAGGLGIIWIIGRILYMRSYAQSGGNRMPGFIMAGTATMLLLLDALVNVVLKMLGH